VADRDRPPSARNDATEGFLRRWSRRKAEARSTATASTRDSSDPAELAAASSEQTAEADQGGSAPTDREDLPDIESLDANSDFTVFMRPNVPEHLRTLALRKLWRSDPIFSELDGLVEYGEDYSIPFWPKGTIRTAYQIGRGFVNELEKLGGAEAPESPATGPVPEPGRAVASDDPEPAVDAAADMLQPLPESMGSDEAQAALRPAEVAPEAKRRPRPLPRRG
jgi:hypothetical protein